jgi:ABC-2 type transport system permease protein
MIIFSIAAKDIQDAVKNRFVISQIIAVTLILVSIKGLSLIIEPPAMQLVIYDPAGSTFSELIDESEDFSAQQVASLDELQAAISSMGFGLGAQLGLEIPPGVEIQLENAQPIEVQGYVSWANRNQAEPIRLGAEEALQELTGKPVHVSLEGNIITPAGEVGLLVGIVTIFAVTIILTIGITLVPTLMIEEKQNRTLDALLLSPASIWQVVAGKAIAGAFYVLVTTLIVYLVYWSGVYSWGVTMLFVFGAVLFAVSVGLLLGIIFNRQQEMTGWLSLIMVLITGTIFIELINLDLPSLLEQILPWLPPVALAQIFWASFSSQVDFQQVLASFAAVVFFSAALFGIIIWRIRQIDR